MKTTTTSPPATPPAPTAVRQKSRLRGSKGPWLLVVALGALLAVPALSGCLATTPSPLEEQALDIERSLMCPICEGQTIAESRSNLALQIKANIREQLSQGKTKEQILQFYVERYGDRILAAPPPSGINWALWLGPFAAIALGTFLLYRLVLAFRRQPAAQPTKDTALSPEERRSWEERIKAEMEGRQPPAPDRKPH